MQCFFMYASASARSRRLTDAATGVFAPITKNSKNGCLLGFQIWFSSDPEQIPRTPHQRLSKLAPVRVPHPAVAVRSGAETSETRAHAIDCLVCWDEDAPVCVPPQTVAARVLLRAHVYYSEKW